MGGFVGFYHAVHIVLGFYVTCHRHRVWQEDKLWELLKVLYREKRD